MNLSNQKGLSNYFADTFVLAVILEGAKIRRSWSASSIIDFRSSDLAFLHSINISSQKRVSSASSSMTPILFAKSAFNRARHAAR